MGTPVASNPQTAHGLLTRLIALAYVDQSVDSRELELIYSIALERGVPKETLETIMLKPHLVDATLPATPHERVSHLYDLARLVVADEVILPEEKAMLRSSVLLYEFDEENADGIVEFLLGHAQQKTNATDVIQFVQKSI